MEGIHAEDVLFMMLQGQDLEKAVPTDGKNLVSKETGLGPTWGSVPENCSPCLRTAGMEGGASVAFWKVCWKHSEGGLLVMAGLGKGGERTHFTLTCELPSNPDSL